jgi:hypothetical protein
MASNYIELPQKTGGTGAVDSVNGLTGVVVLTKSNIGLGNVNNTSDADKPISTATQSALDNKQDLIPGNNSRFVYKNSSGVVESLDTHSVGTDGTIFISTDFDITTAGNVNGLNSTYGANATENAPNNNFQADYMQINIDSNSDGFQLGTNGTGLSGRSLNVIHVGLSDVGGINLHTTNFSLGNGTDPIDIKGVGYSFGFGQVNANVNINGPMQGYGFQPNINAAATLDTATAYTTAFYDNANYGCASPGYTSANLSPQIASINNNSNYSGVNIAPTIPTFTGNAGFIGLSVSGTLGTFNNNGYFHGLNVNPTITSARYAAGLQVSMDNVTPYAGVQATLTEQDLTFTWNQPGSFNNTYTMEYTPGATAGSEVVSISGNAIEVQIEDGVSTATQIKTALEASMSFNSNVTVTVSGTASNAQDIFGPTNFAGGVDAGNVKAAYLDGDVEITGSLTFGGALSIGKLNAFGIGPLVDGGGTPTSIHTLITQPTVADNVTVANADLLGVNTAMLLSVGANSTVTTSFLGVAALGLPAVVNIGAGSSVDRVDGAAFAISLDAGAGAGGSIANVDLCRALALPNGITTVTRLKGYAMDLPFGDPGTTTWGFYESPGVHNYMAGNLLIGGTAGSDDTVTNSSVALEIKSTTKAFMNARMTTTERNALTAVNGMQIYNSTVDKLQVYAAGAWVDLH